MKKFSIIIPTHNRPRELLQCLEAIQKIDYPAEQFEVIVVDDGSTVPYGPVVERFSSGLEIRLLRQEKAGPAAARNKGAGMASGEYLVFTDDDCRPGPGWLRAFAERRVSHPKEMLGGLTVNGLPENPYSAASQGITSILYAYHNRIAEDSQLFTSNNICVPAIEFKSIGGFDTRFKAAAGEDLDICRRWRAAGGKMIFIPLAVVYHNHRLTMTSYYRQHFRYGKAGFLLRKGVGDSNHRSLKGTALFYLSLPTLIFRALPWNDLSRSLLIFYLIITSKVSFISGFLLQAWEDRSTKA